MDYKVLGFFDESEDNDVLCLGGVVGMSHHWDNFEQAWNDKLSVFSGLDEFHAEHCVNRGGYWENWRDPEQRNEALLQFVSLIDNPGVPCPMGLVVAIDLGAYRNSSRVGHDSPWVFAFRHIVERMSEMQQFFNGVTRSGAGADLFFDNKPGVKGRVNAFFTKHRNALPLKKIEFCDSRDKPGIQAADLLVYETRKLISEVIVERRPMRESWRALMDSTTFGGPNGTRRVFAEYWDAESMKFADLPRT